MAGFIKIQEDKFKDRTDYETVRMLPLTGNGNSSWIKNYINIRRVIISPDHDDSLIDIVITDRNSNWPCLSEGNIIMIVDGEKFILNPIKNWHQNYSQSSEYKKSDGRIDIVTDNYYKESYYYVLNNDLLQRICNSKSFAMKIYAGSGSLEVTNVNAIVVYFKLFYNAVYDKSAYTDVVANAEESYTSMFASSCSFSDIKLDGTGAGSTVPGILVVIIIAFILLIIFIIVQINNVHT